MTTLLTVCVPIILSVDPCLLFPHCSNKKVLEMSDDFTICTEFTEQYAKDAIIVFSEEILSKLALNASSRDLREGASTTATSLAIEHLEVATAAALEEVNVAPQHPSTELQLRDMRRGNVYCVEYEGSPVGVAPLEQAGHFAVYMPCCGLLGFQHPTNAMIASGDPLPVQFIVSSISAVRDQSSSAVSMPQEMLDILTSETDSTQHAIDAMQAIVGFLSNVSIDSPDVVELVKQGERSHAAARMHVVQHQIAHARDKQSLLSWIKESNTSLEVRSLLPQIEVLDQLQKRLAQLDTNCRQSLHNIESAVTARALAVSKADATGSPSCDRCGRIYSDSELFSAVTSSCDHPNRRVCRSCLESRLRERLDEALDANDPLLAATCPICKILLNEADIRRVAPDVLRAVAGTNLLRAAFNCSLCADEYHPNEEAFWLGCCSRTVCRDSIRGYIQAQISDGRLPIICPFGAMRTCDKELALQDVNLVLDPTYQERLCRLQFRKLQGMDGTAFCRAADCDGIVFHEDLGLPGTASTAKHHFVCTVNGEHQWCLQCDVIWHKNMTCAQYQEWKQDNANADLVTDRLIREMGWKRCPDCHSVVERRGGCNAVKCRCGTSFCYLCGEAAHRGADIHAHFGIEGTPCYAKIFEGVYDERQLSM